MIHNFTEKIIHYGKSHYVIRKYINNNQSIIIKKSIDSSDHSSVKYELKNEFSILNKLQGNKGIPRIINFKNNELILEDFDGISLDKSNLIGKLNLNSFLKIAKNITQVLKIIHDNGIIHKDLNPSNIIIKANTLDVQIIDFDLATTFAFEHLDFEHHSKIVGTLEYISPEQTGRMNRIVDYRTDFYSLGATFYYLLSGETLYKTNDSLELIHAHLTNKPLNINKKVNWLTDDLSKLIMSLLEKEPDNRYQSSFGIINDLENIEKYIKNKKYSFKLKEKDLTLSPKNPNKLYGREKELKLLMDEFNEITKGKCKTIFVSGYSGVGKTSLIREIYLPITTKRGLFVSGKSDQFQYKKPFSAPSQCFHQLCQLILSEKDTKIDKFKKNIIKSFGNEIAALYDIIPDLKKIIGEDYIASELGPLESQIRLRNLLIGILKEVSSPEYPLVIFLDDLQWADQPTLDLINDIIQEDALRGLFLIGSFRDNEIDSTHHLFEIIENTKLNVNKPKIINLQSLNINDIDYLLSDILQSSKEEVEDLAKQIHSKTRGNPFFTVELINTLHRQGILYPDTALGKWQWKSELIASFEVSQNVVNLLEKQIHDFDEELKEILIIASYLGNNFNLGLLSTACNIPVDSISKLLLPAFERGIIITSNSFAIKNNDKNTLIKFCHDRMQQAFYEMKKNSNKKNLHLQLARRFSEDIKKDYLHFRAAENYSYCVDLITDHNEKEKARRILYNASLKARLSNSFFIAENYIKLAINLLPSNCWENMKDESFNYFTNLHLILYSLSKYEEVDKIFNYLSKETINYEKMIEPICIQIISLSNRTNFLDAVNLAKKYLSFWNLSPIEENINDLLEKEMNIFYQEFESGSLEKLKSGYYMTNKSLLKAVKLLNRAAPAALFLDPLLGFWFGIKLSNILIKHGYSSDALMGLTWVILCTIALKKDFKTGYHTGKIAMEIASNQTQSQEIARAYHIFSIVICHWGEPIENALEHTFKARKGLINTGDLEFASFTYYTAVTILMEITSIKSIKKELDLAFQFTRKIGNKNTEYELLSLQQFIYSLEGKTDSFDSFNDEEFSEDLHIKTAPTRSLAIYNIMRSLSALIYNNIEKMIYHALEAPKYTPYITGFYPTSLANVLESLSYIYQIENANSQDERKILLDKLEYNQIWLNERAKESSNNFIHLFYFVEAEKYNILDDKWKSIQYYEKAMTLSQANHRPWHYALTTERAGRFYMKYGLENSGRILLSKSYNLYNNWGATNKSEVLLKEFPFIGANLSSSNKKTKNSFTTSDFDYFALLKASQTLALEKSQKKLIENVVNLVAQITASTDIQFLLKDDNDNWFLETGIINNKRLKKTTLDNAIKNHLISKTAFKLGIKYMNNIISEDAVIDSRFKNDQCYKNLEQCSLFALPIILNDKIKAFLILENKLFRNAFSPSHIESISLLCSQLAISIENIRLYESLENKVLKRTEDLKKANLELEDKNIKITDSLNYAHTIQSTILPKNSDLLNHIKNFFIIWKPCNIVGGDFYWFKKTNYGFFIAVIDCTGHGVPGAMMTMSANSILDRIINENINCNPSDVLNNLNIILKTTLNQNNFSKKDLLKEDGLDIALCFINKSKSHLTYSGAGISLYYNNNDDIIRIEADKQSIGYRRSKQDYIYKNHTIELKDNRMFYITTDGFEDQNSETSNLRYGRKKLMELMKKIHKIPLNNQKKYFENSLSEHMGNVEQRDDITLLGFKIN